MQSRSTRCLATLGGVLLVAGLVAACTEGRPGAARGPASGEVASSEAASAEAVPGEPAAGDAAPGAASGEAAAPPSRVRHQSLPQGRFVGALFLYSFDPLTGILTAGSPVQVPPDATRDAALAALLLRMNEAWKGRRRGEAAGVTPEDGREILRLNLVDSGERSGAGSWYDALQGSAGGAATQAFLVATLLQPEYGGSWFDGVHFLLNGEPMGEMDHVNLAGDFWRDAPLNDYAPVPVTAVQYPAEYEMQAYLRGALDLEADARIQLIRLPGSGGEENAVFFVTHPERSVRRGVVALGAAGPRLLAAEEDPCGCSNLRAEAVELVPAEGPFVLTRFSPRTGTCLGLDVVRILAASGSGTLREVWSGTTFEGNGSRSQVATVEFVDRDGDGNREIVRRGRLVDCRDDCLCRDGPVLESFEVVYAWAAGTGGFVERSRLTEPPR